MSDTSSSTRSVTPPAAGGQQYVAATVHLAGAVQTETGHAALAGVGHVMARIGGVLIYFLDRAAIAGFAIGVSEAAQLGRQTFGDDVTRPMPGIARAGNGQEASIVLRLRGEQDVARPVGRTNLTSHDGSAFVSVRIGGLTLVLRDQLALGALAQSAAIAQRAGDVLWPDEDADLQLPASVVLPAR